MDEYLGVIKLFTGTFAPQGYMFCWGQSLSVSQYTALYSLLGTQFGGDGQTTFKLPDLRGIVPLGTGQSQVSGHTYQQGNVGGTEAVSLTTLQMPVHNHSAVAQGNVGSLSVTVNAGTAGTPTNDPSGAYWGKSPGAGPVQSQDYTNEKNVQMAADAVQVNGNITGLNVQIGANGGSQPHGNMQPFLALNFIICVEGGVYPPRN